ncbi:MAG: PEP-CTERM sorting domain-containing protein [Verrucomicrobiota bacterium]
MKLFANSLKLLVLLALVSLGVSNVLQAETLSIFDDSFIVSNYPVTSNILSGRWGTWDSLNSVFTQAVTSSLNAGYVDLSTPELSITLNQLNNTVYTAGTPLALAIFTDGSADAQTLNWGGTVTRAAVLTDSSWVAPTFGNNANPVDWVFTINTAAVKGTFSYNAGNQLIGLATVPEPTTWALLAGSLTMVMVFRRRSRV